MAEEKNQDIFGTIIIIGIILFCAGYFYSSHAYELTEPLLYLSYGILKLCSVITDNTSIANKVIAVVMLTNLQELSLNKSSAVIAAAGYYTKYLLLLYSFILITYFHIRPSKHKFTRKLSPQKLIENNVNYTPCLAPIVYRNPNEEKYTKIWGQAKTPMEFLITNDLLINQETGEIIDSKWLSSSGCLIESDPPDNDLDLAINNNKLLNIISLQLGKQYFDNRHKPDYILALEAAFHAFNHEDINTGQAILDEISLSFLNKKEMHQVKIKMKSALKYLCKNTITLSSAPVHVSLVRQFSKITPALSTTEFIWLKPINRILWYALHQVDSDSLSSEGLDDKVVGKQVYWSESLAVGLAIETGIVAADKLIDNMLLSLEQYIE